MVGLKIIFLHWYKCLFALMLYPLFFLNIDLLSYVWFPLSSPLGMCKCLKKFSSLSFVSKFNFFSALLVFVEGYRIFYVEILIIQFREDVAIFPPLVSSNNVFVLFSITSTCDQLLSQHHKNPSPLYPGLGSKSVVYQLLHAEFWKFFMDSF